MHLPLVKCFWCENCQSIIDSAKRCEGCGSHMSIVALSIWMDRRIQTRAVSEIFIKPEWLNDKQVKRLLYPQCDPTAVK